MPGGTRGAESGVAGGQGRTNAGVTVPAPPREPEETAKGVVKAHRAPAAVRRARVALP